MSDSTMNDAYTAIALEVAITRHCRTLRQAGMPVRLIPAQLFAVAFEVALHLAQTVAAELFAHCRG